MIEPCTLCEGSGYTTRDDGAVVTCRCTIHHALLTRVRQTPGLAGARLGKGCVDFVSGRPVPLMGSAVIRCAWQAMPNHLAGWLFASHAKPNVTMTSTAELRAAYLDGTLPNLLKGADLVVVNLLDTRTGGKILPDILLETVALARSIWLVHSLGNTFGEGHPCWNSSIGEAVSGFARRDLGPPPDLESVFGKLGLGGVT